MKSYERTVFLVLVTLMLITAFLSRSASAVTTNLLAVSVNNRTIYKINLTSGNVNTVSTTSDFNSVSLAADSQYAYYWNAEGTHKGLVKWDSTTDTHTVINTTDISEENAAVDNAGTLWVLDRSNSFVDGVFTHDFTNKLYTIDKVTGVRTLSATLPDIGGYAVGDIAWGPDGKLYISTNNQFWGYDPSNHYNYVWDPLDPGNIVRKGGVYHAGLAWVNGKLYGSRTLQPGNDTGGIFELDPADFSEKTTVPIATMPTGVTIGDLAVIPEPATISLLTFALIALSRKKKS